MNKWELFAEAKRLFDAGENVSAALKGRLDAEGKRLMVEAVYDLQAGSYSQTYFDGAFAEYEARAADLFDGILRDIGAEDVLDCGIGEATRWLRKGAGAGYRLHGFDISLSRLSYARANLEAAGMAHSLFTADMAHIPAADNSVDCVVSMHAAEPNGGAEDILLAEMLRVSSRYLVLMEPDFQRAAPEQQERMQRLGYVTRLFPALLENDDLTIHRYEAAPMWTNPLNRASIIVCEKKAPQAHRFAFTSPLSGAALANHGSYMHDGESGFAFPVMDGIPVLKRSDAVFLGMPHTRFGGTAD